MQYDYGIIGGGPAGYTSAINLARRGFKVILFEQNKLGGTCLNKGCIPTKSMIHSSELYKQIRNTDSIGIELEIKNFDFSKIIEKRDKTIERIRKSLELAVKNSGVEIIYEHAEIKDDNTIVANSIEYKVKDLIIATGSTPRELEGLRFDKDFILSSDDILNLKELPNSILILGSGAIGIEWARIFSNFGVKVFLVELAEHLIPLADIDVSKRIERIFKQAKIEFYTNTSINSINAKTVFLSNEKVIEPNFILSAVGRNPLVTSTQNGIMLGDVCGEIQLAHYAISQAKNYAQNIDFNKSLVPSVIYGEPEIAWIGLKEQECNDDYKKVLLPITALGKSWCDDTTDGFIKIIAKDDYIVGAHIVSKEASALIHQLLIAIQCNIPITKLKELCVAHPTFSEGIYEALLQL